MQKDRLYFKISLHILLLSLLTLLFGTSHGEEFDTKILRIPLEISYGPGHAGSLIAEDVDNNGTRDLVVTAPGYIGAYATSGDLLWSRRVDIRVGEHSEIHGLPGLHAPGVQAGDINGDGRTEIVFLDREGRLRVLRGDSGLDLWSCKLPVPPGARRWEHLVIADFRGMKGDRDLFLQTTNAQGYRLGRYVAAFAVDSLQAGKTDPLWQRDDFRPSAHGGARLVDLDGDGRDEVLGATILGPDGKILVKVPVQGHLDGLTVGDVRPDLPGLEVVMQEEGPLNRVFLVGLSGLIWKTAHKDHLEPQNCTVGHFIPERRDMQIWCRSRQHTDQTPFLFDGYGKLIAEYEMKKVAPADWSDTGVEVISSIHWTGEKLQYAVAKERHAVDDAVLFDPVSGRFLLRLHDAALRIYVADVIGDWREEIIIASRNRLHIYYNPKGNPRPEAPRLWTEQYYRRNKMTWNYYNP